MSKTLEEKAVKQQQDKDVQKNTTERSLNELRLLNEEHPQQVVSSDKSGCGNCG